MIDRFIFFSNPQMGNSSIDELLRQRLDAEINRFQQDSNNTKWEKRFVWISMKSNLFSV